MTFETARDAFLLCSQVADQRLVISARRPDRRLTTRQSIHNLIKSGRLGGAIVAGVYVTTHECVEAYNRRFEAEAEWLAQQQVA